MTNKTTDKKIPTTVKTKFNAEAQEITPEVYNEGVLYHGFRLIEKRFVKETNAECLYFRHMKSGARLLKITADDPNKFFNITFKTLPDNDSGTPHILEHSVLNGSRNFPVKSPFDVLLKGSLNTFLNAMTGQDHTCYPLASMNTTDYFNLMHVYLDAVFHPLMLEDDRILKQEGWHMELTSKDAPLIYKGVVYNEMKGTFSNPLYELYYIAGKHLFPDNIYGNSSGGHPGAIPQLTQEDFTAFHRKYYHPSNSYILLYGDACLNRELDFINKNYLSDFDVSNEDLHIPVQKPFDSVKTVTEPYPVAEGSPTEGNTYLSLSYVTPPHTGKLTTMALDLLVNALVNHESAPLRLALQEAGIGREVTGWFTEAQQNIITIIVPNANPEDAGRFREVAERTFKSVASEGFDKEIIEGILNRSEFQLKEGDTPQKGLMYLEMITQDWLFGDDPFTGMEFEKPLSGLRMAVKKNLLEDLISQFLIGNPHALLLTMVPDPGLQGIRDALVAEKLEAVKGKMTDAEVDVLVQETHDLMEYQQREDLPEALATIPMLQLSDISPQALFFDLEKISLDDVQVMHHHQFTNGIVYTSLYFDMRTLPLEYIMYASLLTSLLGKLNTVNYAYGQLDNELNIHTGGFVTNLATFLEKRSDDNLLPKLVISAKATRMNTGKMTDLLAEIILKSKYFDKERLRNVIKRHHSKVDANIRQNGMNYAITRANSHFSNRGMFNELTSGVDYYRFITRLADNFDELSDEISQKLETTAKTLFNRNNLLAHVTCHPDELPGFLSGLASSLANMPESYRILNPWKFEFRKVNEAILSASQVQYVVKSHDFKKLGFEWNGRLSVLNQIISTDWLQNQVRVMGGAYGGFCGFSPGGNVYFASYRDPNLLETIEAFDSTPAYLERFSAGEQEMTRYIIGTIAGLDQPKTPSQKGSAAMHYFFEQTTAGMLNKERADILATTAGDIRNLAPLVSAVISQNNYCVYGNEGKIAENARLFDHLIRISEQKS
jgi:presequence protease